MTQPLSLGRVVLYCLTKLDASSISVLAREPYAQGDEVAATVVRLMVVHGEPCAALEIHLEMLRSLSTFVPEGARQLLVTLEPADPPEPGHWRWPPRV